MWLLLLASASRREQGLGFGSFRSGPGKGSGPQGQAPHGFPLWPQGFSPISHPRRGGAGGVVQAPALGPGVGMGGGQLLAPFLSLLSAFKGISASSSPC